MDTAASRSRLIKPWFINLMLGIALVAITFLVFAHTLTLGFVNWDDPIHVYANPYLTSSPPNLAHFWRAPYQALYIPLSYMAYAVIAHFSHSAVPITSPTGESISLDPHWFHAANLALHIGNVLLVYAILRMVLSSRRSATWGTPARENAASKCETVADIVPKGGQKASEPENGDVQTPTLRVAFVAFGGAVLFAVHPFQVESVAWISELRGLLGSFLSLACLAAYLSYAHPSALSGTCSLRRRGYYAASIVLFALALLAKPSAVALLLIAAAIDVVLIRGSLRKTGWALAPWALIAAPLVLITRTVQSILTTPLWQRPFIAGDALAFYLSKLVFPIGLTVDYGHTPASVMSHPATYVIWLLPALLAVAAYRGRRRYPELFAAVLIFIAGVAPVLGLVPFEFQHFSTVTDRYIYLSLLGPALAAATLLMRAPRPVYCVYAVACCALAVAAVMQVRVWDNSLTLFKHAVAMTPSSARMHHNYGVSLQQAGRDQEAFMQYSESLALEPGYALGHDALGTLFQRHGQTTQAIEQYREAIRLSPGLARPHCDLGLLLEAEGQDSGALTEFEACLGTDPEVGVAHRGLGLILLKHGQPQNAVRELTYAVRYSPNDAAVRRDLDVALAAEAQHPA